VTLAYSPNAAALLTSAMAALLTALIVPLVRRLGLKLGLVDTPDSASNTPCRWCGSGVWESWQVSAWLSRLTWAWGGFAELPPTKDQAIWTTLAGALCFFVIGLADDIFALPPLPRLMGQVAGGDGGLGSRGPDRQYRTSLRPDRRPADPRSPPQPEPAGHGRLAGGNHQRDQLARRARWAGGRSEWHRRGGSAVGEFQPQPTGRRLLAASLAGASLGFLRHNFNPARIFMGDGGSYFLGFTLAAISIVGPAKGLTSVSLLSAVADPLPAPRRHVGGDHGPAQRRSLPLLPRSPPPSSPLLRAGLSHRRTVVLIYAFTQWLAALALVVANAEMRFLWLALATAVLIAVLVATRRQIQQEDPMTSHRPHRQGVEVLCIGTELLLGNILNSNARWLAEQLAAMGLPHFRQQVVGDNRERLIEVVREAAGRSRILITTGGLGPTPDDLTTEAIASAFGVPLVHHPEVWADIEAKIGARHGKLAASNRRQALLPEGAQVLPNPTGTAPGMIWSPIPGFTVLTFPGVPSELRAMWAATAVPWLEGAGLAEGVFVSRMLRIWGLAESLLAERCQRSSRSGQSNRGALCGVRRGDAADHGAGN
jgi:molybdenum cofactor synthesis domain-containing protein